MASPAYPGLTLRPLDRLLPDRVLGMLTLAMLALVIAALLRGHAYWGGVPWPVWAHLATLMPALALTPVMLTRPKGTRRHRQLGYAWVALLTATALISFAIRLSRHGGLSAIHILSAYVLIQTFFLVRAARRHDVAGHRGGVRGLVIGALLIAGFFTFPFHRMLGEWLFG